jgi:tetratricopeptide (TPR) repeat protein
MRTTRRPYYIWGDIKKAISVLEQVEKRDPGTYATAANLGTAYELNGENAKALEWIKESLRRNDRAHQGTEWLHVKILEAKLALEREPQWLRTNSVLGIKYDTAGKPLMPERVIADHTGQPKTAQEVEEALVYQLHERLEFVPRPDPVVADLLFELGNLLAITRTVEHAAGIYGLALSYNPQQRELVQARVEYSNSLMRRAAMREYARYGVPLTVLLAAACIAAYYLLRRAPLRNSTSSVRCARMLVTNELKRKSC